MTAFLCAQPGCTGTIEDGYCTICGIAPPPSAAGRTAGGLSAASGAAPSVGSASAASQSHGSLASRPSTVGSARGGLGAGLVEVPAIMAGDPASAVLSDPQVKEGSRFCASCGQPVGRGSTNTPGRTEGFCKNCGARFSFQPKLKPGDLVAGQYEVLGCLAHGGLGWIYLARDRNVSDRWVVLKGLLNSGDADAQAAAVAERRFLAEVEHPSIVRIYNFVEHPDSQSGEPTGYIVMEYVGGQSLRQIVLDRRAAGETVPLPHALAYAIEVLPALGYLHRLGLVYCDFKPDNVLQVEEQLKLIDLGGVRRMEDDDSPIYGTVGYQAPEIATAGPSPASDLYTVGRALAVMTFEFSGYTGTYAHRLPSPASVPVLARNESFYRLLCRATAPNPLDRFGTAAEMIDQLTGVLREVLAAGDSTPRPSFSRRFTPELLATGTSAEGGSGPPAGPEIVAGLPVPVVDSTDPAAGYLATLGTLGPSQQVEALQQALSAPISAGVADGIEMHLALARASIANGDPAGASQVLAELSVGNQADWRVTWYRGSAEAWAGRLPLARAAFEAVYDVLPGELAPKLAVGLAAEATGDYDSALRYFGVVWTTDRSYVSAAFGLARVRLAGGDRAGAVDVLASVPDSSSHYVSAQVAAVRAQVSAADPAVLSATDLHNAGRRLDGLRLDAAMRHALTAEVLQAALPLADTDPAAGNGRLLDCDVTDRGLRLGLERTYRALARLSATREERFALVDLANGVRPRTWS
jgi:serine/threonine-protein kinase PknG